MVTTKEFKGLRWLPEDTENQVSGTLLSRKTKQFLKQLVCWVPYHLAGGNVPQYDVIWGISSEAKEISVFNSYESITLNTECLARKKRYWINI